MSLFSFYVFLGGFLITCTGQTPAPILTVHGLKDVVPCKEVPLGVKIVKTNFHPKFWGKTRKSSQKSYTAQHSRHKITKLSKKGQNNVFWSKSRAG